MNDNIQCSSIQLCDLPDEILMIIFKKLNNILLLYSLSHVDERLNRIIYDPMFTHRLSLLLFEETNQFVCLAYPLPSQILDRYCLDILPEIHENIKWLDVESSSFERVFSIKYYSNLVRIGFYNIQADAMLNFLSGKSFI